MPDIFTPWGMLPATPTDLPCAGAPSREDVARVREAAPATLPPLAMAGRRWRVGESFGEVFAEGEEFEGITLTVELFSPKEAHAVALALFMTDAPDMDAEID